MGRPKSTNVIRDKNGKSRGENIASILSVGLSKRFRDRGIPDPFIRMKNTDDRGRVTFDITGIRRSDAVDNVVVFDDRTGSVVRASQDAGHVLGILKGWGVPSGISQNQFLTGMAYAEIVRAYQSMILSSPGTVKSPGFEVAPRGEGTNVPSPERENYVKGRYVACFDELIKTGMVLESGERCKPSEIAELTYDACLDICDVRKIGEREIGMIRVGLNAIAHALK